MASKQLQFSSPSSSENCQHDSRYSWFSSQGGPGHGYVMNTQLKDIYRNNNTSVPEENCFPFWARKCRCAECIIAKNTMEAKSLASNASKYGYSHLRQSNEYSSQATDGYNSDLKTKGNLVADQARPGNTNGITWWPGQELFMASPERRPIVRQNETGHLTVKLDQHKTLPPPTQQLYRPETVKGNKAEANNHGWSWFGNSNELSFHKQQDFTNIHHTNPSRYLRDPRLKIHGRSDSIYRRQAYNFVSAAELGGMDEYRKQAISKKYREETEQKIHDTMPVTWWLNASSVSECPEPTAHAQSNYQERRAAAVRMHRGNSESSEERKLQTAWGTQMQSSPERAIKRGINDTSFHENNLRNAIPQSTPPITKTHRTLKPSKAGGTNRLQQPFCDIKKRNLANNCSLNQLENMVSDKEEPGDISSYQHAYQNTISAPNNNQKVFKDREDTKGSDICAREERIRSLKMLLEKQEKALEALRFLRKTSFADEKGDNHISCNENRIQKSSDQENSAILEECCLTDGAVILGNSLKRRWLKNWNLDEEEDVEHKSPKIEKRKEIHSHNSESEEENLSNAEYTAVEGLVRLGKD